MVKCSSFGAIAALAVLSGRLFIDILKKFASWPAIKLSVVASNYTLWHMRQLILQASLLQQVFRVSAIGFTYYLNESCYKKVE